MKIFFGITRNLATLNISEMQGIQAIPPPFLLPLTQNFPPSIKCNVPNTIHLFQPLEVEDMLWQFKIRIVFAEFFAPTFQSHPPAEAPVHKYCRCMLSWNIGFQLRWNLCAGWVMKILWYAKKIIQNQTLFKGSRGIRVMESRERIASTIIGGQQEQ